MTINAMLREKIAELRLAEGLVEVKLYGPCAGVLGAIEDFGGQVGERGYEVWCNSQTCTHSSHSAGQEWQVVVVPKAWVDEAKDASNYEWDYDDNEEMNCQPVMIVPAGELFLVLSARFRHFAESTEIVCLRPEASGLFTPA